MTVAESLRDFLNRRERELLAELVPAEGQVTAIKNELAEIRQAKALLTGADSERPKNALTGDLDLPVWPDVASGLSALARSNNPLMPHAVPPEFYTAMDLNNNLSLRMSEKPTIKQMAQKALENDVEFRRNGATSNEIRAHIKAVYNEDIEISSLSPQLSRLREDGAVELSNGRWKRVQR